MTARQRIGAVTFCDLPESGCLCYLRSTMASYMRKLAIAVALASIYPTVKFLRWRKALDPAAMPAIRRVLHLELVGIVLILLCAALMARGPGQF